MKVSAPIYACGSVAHVLHDAGVLGVLMMRTGPGWMFEFMAPAEAANQITSALAKLGLSPEEKHAAD